MDYTTIQAQARSDQGKGSARRTRREGRIPAVAYGGSHAPMPLTVNPKDLTLLHKGALGWNSPFVLAVDGGDDVGLAMLQAVQKHPVSGALLHADFVRVAADANVQVKVPVIITGKSVGVELGAKLMQPLREVTVSCLPSKIPTSVEIDVTEMDIGDKIMLSAIPLAEGVTLVIRHDVTVVNVARGRGGAAEETVDEAEATEEEETEE